MPYTYRRSPYAAAARFRRMSSGAVGHTRGRYRRTAGYRRTVSRYRARSRTRIARRPSRRY